MLFYTCERHFQTIFLETGFQIHKRKKEFCCFKQMFHYTLLLLSKFRAGFQKEIAVSSVISEIRPFPYSSAGNSSPLASSLHAFMILGETEITWHSTCLSCTAPWVPHPALQKLPVAIHTGVSEGRGRRVGSSWLFLVTY